MNCDDFLANLETGGFMMRSRARRHMKRCPRCAAVHAALYQTKQRLAAPAAPSPNARRLWEQAAGTVAPTPRRQLSRRLLSVAALSAAACLLFFVFGPAVRHPDRPKRLAQTDFPGLQVADESIASVTIREIDAVGQLAELADAVERLDAELATLRNLAERREVERQLAVVLKRFDGW